MLLLLLKAGARALAMLECRRIGDLLQCLHRQRTNIRFVESSRSTRPLPSSLPVSLPASLPSTSQCIDELAYVAKILIDCRRSLPDEIAHK